MKLDERKIAEIKGKDDVAIHCPKLEYVEPLFEAMGRSEFKTRDAEYRSDEDMLSVMINHPEQIKPLPRWTPEEQEDAKKDKFRFNYVTKDSDAQRNVTLWENEPKFENDIWQGNLGWLTIGKDAYPSLKPGECESLQEIANGN